MLNLYLIGQILLFVSCTWFPHDINLSEEDKKCISGLPALYSAVKNTPIQFTINCKFDSVAIDTKDGKYDYKYVTSNCISFSMPFDDIYIKLVSDTIPRKSKIKFSNNNEILVEVLDKTISGIYRVDDNIKVISDRAFANCTNLEKIILPNVVTIGGSAFANCNSLKEIVLSKNLDTIWQFAFANCRSLEHITIPASVRYISFNPFYHDTLLKLQTNNKRFQIINDYLIDENKKKIITYFGKEETVNIPKGIKIIGEYSFSHNSKCQNVFFSESVTEIGSYAFEYCNKLKNVTFSKNIKKINNNPFLFGHNIIVTVNNPTFYVYKGLLVDNNSFNVICYLGSDSIVDLFNGELPPKQQIRSIGHYSFADCNMIKSIKLNRYIDNIESSAFDGCINLKLYGIEKVINKHKNRFNNNINWEVIQ